MLRISKNKQVVEYLEGLKMSRSPNKQYRSSPDISNLAEPSNVNITIRKRKHDDDFTDALKELTSEIKNTFNIWKAEIHDNISQVKID
ncbi:unnamed protein product [Parnassius apollo]|uniref:(apollo) hypothetical protein n=1 Tax=Parnassius apollo TaxID=110799 RepID=A0A8S3XA14_PARAO|nr:unnamed protein product [Parnassius apollo]